MSIWRIPNNEQWAVEQVAHLHGRWQKRLLANHSRKSADYDREVITGKNAAGRAANIELRSILERLQSIRLPLDASDGDICARADEFALACMDLARLHHQVDTVRAVMAHFVVSCKLTPPCEEIKNHGAIARMTCRDWWRRGLRNLHARAVEGAAIELGFVNKKQDCYVSKESLARRGQQIRRNTRMLENTLMENEDGQQFSLAELAAKGTANKAIRRGELMTRVAGFEEIARDVGDDGLFITVTCPSRMHKFAIGDNGQVFENKKYDGTNPKVASQYLSTVFKRVRAKLARDKIGQYGVRIAEPHHDGCPHWHILIFHPPGLADKIIQVYRRYALADSPDEPGAQKHRVKSVKIDWSKGSAAGYIAKYISKNIDGLHIENDLFGNPAMQTSAAVDAWASTWRINQFNQIGGAPIGVWRELRRINELPEGAPEHVRRAWLAANKIESGGETRQANFAEYIRAQGGQYVGRKALIKIARAETGQIGRYGDEVAPRPVGVETVSGEFYRDGIIPDRFRLVHWLIESVRKVWRVVRGGFKRAGFSAPRTRVNNCTAEKNFSGLLPEEIDIFIRGKPA